MAFETPTIETIYNRMKADLEERLDTSNWFSRSMALTLLAVFAGAIYPCYAYLTNISKQIFFNTANLEYLYWHLRKYGLPLKPAGYATGTIQATGTNGTLIPEDTEWQTESGEVFVTDADVTISGGVADLDITAQVAGTDGNVSVTTMDLVTAIVDVDTTATVTETPSGGTDQETQAEAVARLLQRTANPPGSGNEGDYERWALETSGVGRVWVKRADDWYGAGTVGVILATSALEVVDSAVKSAAETYIDSKRPVGADVYVVDPIPNDVDYYISITPNTSAIQTAITAALTERHLLDSEPGESMKISAIRTAIGSTGVTDYTITSIEVDGTPVSVADLTSTGLNLLRFNSATYASL